MIKLLLLTIFSFVYTQSFKEKSELKLHSIFPKIETLTFHYFELEKAEKRNIEKRSRQGFFRNKLYTWKIELADSSIRYAILDNVIGKVQPITFLVIFKAEGKINFVEVLKYRESYGYEVSRESFRKQFVGKKHAEEMQVAESIKNIAGATISVRSLSKGVQKLSYLFPSVKRALDEL